MVRSAPKAHLVLQVQHWVARNALALVRRHPCVLLSTAYTLVPTAISGYASIGGAAHTKAMKNNLHTSIRRGGVVVQYDNTIAGPVALGDAMLALGRIAAELLLDLNNSEVIPVAA